MISPDRDFVSSLNAGDTVFVSNLRGRGGRGGTMCVVSNGRKWLKLRNPDDGRNLRFDVSSGVLDGHESLPPERQTRVWKSREAHKEYSTPSSL